MSLPFATEPIDRAELDRLFLESVNSLRKRSHLLLHQGHDDQVQRLLIAAQPGTYVRPHQHTIQWEMMTLLRGSLDVMLFDGGARVTCILSLHAGSPILHIAPAAWHSCVIREPDTLVLELKPGPYQPNEFADWAPPEGTPEAAALFSRMDAAKVGAAL